MSLYEERTQPLRDKLKEYINNMKPIIARVLYEETSTELQIDITEQEAIRLLQIEKDVKSIVEELEYYMKISLDKSIIEKDKKLCDGIINLFEKLNLEKNLFKKDSGINL